jgi:hypothetical protein
LDSSRARHRLRLGPRLGPGANRLIAVRALLGGGASAALLPWVVQSLGGDGRTCLHLGALFALGTLATELPAARLGDRDGRARRWLAWSGLVQALGLTLAAFAPSIGWLCIAVTAIGMGAGLATGAEGRAALSIGRDARGIARLEVASLLGKGTFCCAIAVVAVMAQVGARGAIAFSAGGALVAAALATTLRSGDRARTTPRGRRARVRQGDRRAAWSFGVVALMVAVAGLSLAARGTDSIDAFSVISQGSGIVVCAAILAAKSVIARLLAPVLAAFRVVGVAVAAAIVAMPLAFVPRLPGVWVLVDLTLACGVAGAAAAAARGILLARVGPDRAGIASAIEATARRAALAIGALLLAPIAHDTLTTSPYVVAGIAAILGGLAALTPRIVTIVRRRLRPSEPEPLKLSV